MKKPVAILLAVAVLLALAGCGKESALTGTWKLDHVEADGATFTPSELEAMGEDELSRSVIVLKDGGKAYVSEGGDGLVTDWSRSDGGIILNGKALTLTDGLLRLELRRNRVLVFKRVSDSQEITREEPTMPDEPTTEALTDEQQTDEPQTDTEALQNGSDTVDPEFKKTMDSYEAFFDEYAEFMRTYDESDDPASLMTQYTDILTRYAEVTDGLYSIDESSLSAADAAYYAEVTARIYQKLAEVG